MAIEQVQNLPQQYVTDLGVDYGKQLAGLTSIPLDTARLAPQVAGQDPLQQQAYNLATSGVGAYQPFLTQAGAYDTAAQQFGTQAAGTLTGAGALGTQAAGTLGGVGSTLANIANFGTAAQGYSGPQAYSQFMSPYQQDVIDATLSEFDTQAAKGLTGIGTQAAMSGNLGGGREGVMRSEYQSNSDRNRALLNAQLLQQGFGQANQLANQAFNQQGNLAALQGNIADRQFGIADREKGLAGLELGIADREKLLGDQSLTLSKNQQALANLYPSLQSGDIDQLGRLGGFQQIQEQAILDAQREANRLEAFEPYERLGTYGSGVASLFSGNAPFGNQSTITPNPTPLQTALGTGSVLSGIFGGNRSRQYDEMGRPIG